ncbi:hypothetical protein [Oscillibacter sp. 1-3]|uniref:hypothetical protein n=1 Tax=Oscillibacter sp. 1-3 TaxID=1235797 RepID=UPI00058F9408|nr:hypothetical protein [Oscillibacter sp. 1-3]
MGEQRFTKRDWALFRSKIGSWQEAYMGRLCDECIERLSGDGDPSEKFWKLDKRIRSDKRNPGVQLQMTRTNFIYNIIALINNDAISIEALEDFSYELKETVKAFLERQTWDYSDEE